MVSITDIASLGKVNREISRINNGLVSLPLPTTNTGGTRNLNVQGKRRFITIQGNFPGTIAEITAFILDIEDWVNNGVQAARDYTNTFSQVFSVLGADFEWQYDNSSNRNIVYTLQMVEGGTIS